MTKIATASPGKDDGEDGVFSDFESYTSIRIAKKLKVQKLWVEKHFFRTGLDSMKRGNLRFVSGRVLNRWIEEQSEPWDNQGDGGDDQS